MSIITSILAVHQPEQTLVVTKQDFLLNQCNRAACSKTLFVINNRLTVTGDKWPRSACDPSYSPA